MALSPGHGPLACSVLVWLGIPGTLVANRIKGLCFGSDAICLGQEPSKLSPLVPLVDAVTQHQPPAFTLCDTESWECSVLQCCGASSGRKNGLSDIKATSSSHVNILPPFRRSNRHNLKKDPSFFFSLSLSPVSSLFPLFLLLLLLFLHLCFFFFYQPTSIHNHLKSKAFPGAYRMTPTCDLAHLVAQIRKLLTRRA